MRESVLASQNLYRQRHYFQINQVVNLLMTLIGFSTNVIASDAWRLADTGMLPNCI